ncbi:WcaI family glycosyltransferase [Sphingomonas sp. GCM10030256]|uniref:WcaI family glycosyltransferase n=1 Tax=Sphingomonas sp. GCM10030256 TaxID=3273427 RepID=UPI00360D47E5
MRILFIGLNYAPEEIGIGLYSAELCQALVEAGHEVQAVVAHPYYPRWATFPGYGGGYHVTVEGGVRVIRCPIYVPAHPTGLKRLVHHFSFAASALLPTLRAAFRFGPDLVFTVAPSLLSAPLASLVSRLTRARSWLHIQDLEVDASIATGLLPKGGVTERAGRWAERKIYGAFDRITTISPEMVARVRERVRRPERIGELRNWAALERITPSESSGSSYRSEWNIRTPHVALYSGNLGNKQGLEDVVEAARLLRCRADLTFVICGEGPLRDRLEMLAADLPNIRFQKLQPTERLNELLGLATVHLLPQKADAADLVLPSKLTNMLASGKAVVAMAAPGTGLAREVQGCGLVVEPELPNAFAAAIERLVNDTQLREEAGRAAQERAAARWSKAAILASALSQIQQGPFRLKSEPAF